VRTPRGLARLVALLGVSLAVTAFALPVAPRSGELERLGSELHGLLEIFRWRQAAWSVMVVSLDRGDTLFSVAADTARAPASNMKLLTSAAALSELGPDFRFRTYLLTDGAVRGGVLEGDLILYGTGDPGISDRFYREKETVFRELVAQLRTAGITAVAGDLVGDASYLPGPLRPEGWEPEDLNDHFAAAVSALTFNENVVSLRVEPAPQSGWRPTVHTIPDHAGLDVDNRAVTVEGRAQMFIGRDDPMEPIHLLGDIQRGGRDVWRQITVSDPAAFAVAVFGGVLEAEGIQVRGSRRVVTNADTSVLGGGGVTAPSRSTGRRPRILATHVSPPLRDYLAVVNKKSHNLYTELVFRTLSRVRDGTGDPVSSARVVASSIAALRVDTAGLVQTDGSGLSASNRVRAGTFVGLFEGLSATPLWAELWATLPEAGNRREMGRMYRSAAAGNLRAKTGTIKGVSALSGMVQSRDGERLAFSIMVNGTPSTTRAKRVENDIGILLASFTRGAGAAPLPTVAQLPPPPIPSDSGGPNRHRVVAGESMDGIARRFGLTLEDLLRANPTVEPRRLRPGSWVTIPSGLP
jgi:D-alanyl-D-alanine carboxypeptidase/D-alanyl-D-alanine-endopeptidase (penicillin-binding protein 4)